MKFKTKYNSTPDSGEKNSGNCLVEVAGYITAKQRIESMMLAGQRLQDYRKEQFDAQDSEISDDDIPIDPTRGSNYDLADASRDMAKAHDTATRLQAEEKARKDSKKNKKTSTSKVEDEKEVEDGNTKDDLEMDS